MQEKIFRLHQRKYIYSFENFNNKNIVDSYTNFLGFITKYKGLKSEIGNEFVIPVGFISASIEDMGKYLRFYLEDQNKEYISQVTNETVKVGNNTYYGMGMEIIKNDFLQNMNIME